MRTRALAMTVGWVVLSLSCNSGNSIKITDASTGDVRRDSSAGITNQDSGGSTDSSSGGSDSSGGGDTGGDSIVRPADTNRDSNLAGDTLVTGRDAPISDSRPRDAGRDLGRDVSMRDTGTAGNGRSVGSLGQCTNGSCPGAAEFSACMTDSCEMDLRNCFGTSYATANFSGPCADYMTCIWQCPCDVTAKACELACAPLLGAGGCLTCLSNSVCMLRSCGAPPACILPTAPPVDAGGDGAIDGATATGCARAMGCCSVVEAMLGAATGQLCRDALSTATEAECETILSQYGALCP